MKPIINILDAETKKNWINIQNELKKMQRRGGKLRELSEIMSVMLTDFRNSYDQFNQAPPGIKETLEVMLPLSLCNNDEELENALANPDLLSNLQTAITQVNSVQSGLNYVTAALRFIATLVLFFVIAPLVFVSSLLLGLYAGATAPYVGIIILAPLASIPTFFTYKAGYDLLMHGINQTLRTQHENGPDGKILNQFGLFKDAIMNNQNEPPAVEVAEPIDGHETMHEHEIRL